MKTVAKSLFQGLYPVALDQLASHGYLSAQLVQELAADQAKPVPQSTRRCHIVSAPMVKVSACCA